MLDELDDAPNTLLTSDQRRYLSGEKEYKKSDQARWKMYSRIREQLRWTIYDFALLYDNWDELNLDKAFEERDPYWYMMDGATRTISTLYRGMAEDQLSFESSLKDAIYRAESDMNNRRVDVRFDVDPTVEGDVFVNKAIERVNPDDVDSMRIPEMRAVLEELAHLNIDVPELMKQERNQPHRNDENER